MKKWSAAVLIVLIVMVLGGTAFASVSKMPVKVAIYQNEPLLFMENEPRGLFIDIVEEVARLENWDVQYHYFDFADGLKAVDEGQVDLMLGVAYSDGRAQQYDFNDQSIFVNWGQVFRSPKAQIDSIQDLEGAKIGVMKDDIHYIGANGIRNTLAQFDIQASYVEFADKYEILKETEAGRLDACVVNRTFGMLNQDSYKIERTSIQLNPVNVHIIAPMNSDRLMLSTIDNYLEAWKRDEGSIYHKRLNYWFEALSEEHVPVWVWILLMGAACIILVSMIVIIVTQNIIRTKTKELRDLNQTLELKVQERTADLDKTNNKLKRSLFQLEEKQAELEEMNAILEEQVALIERTQDKLIESEKMASLGRMVASLAHEMNTPLGVCVTLQSNMKPDADRMLKALNGGKLTKSSLVEYLEDMKSVAEMLTNNMDNVVDLVDRFKMLSTDRIHMNERKINLYKYLHTQMDALSPELRRSAHTYRIDCPEDIVAVLDPGALSQVIRNLTINSLLHGFEDTTSGVIDIRVKKHGDRVLIEYSDNGKGIDDDVKKRMFEPFFTTKRNKGGTGLGLSIVHSAVTQSLDGEIRVDDRMKNGLKYEIDLPLRQRETRAYSKLV